MFSMSDTYFSLNDRVRVDDDSNLHQGRLGFFQGVEDDFAILSTKPVQDLDSAYYKYATYFSVPLKNIKKDT